MRVAGTPPRRQAQGGAQAVALVADELQAADGHEERAGAHHDREGGLGVHAQQAHQDQAGPVEADSHLHERAQDEVAHEAQGHARAREGQRPHRPGRRCLKMVMRKSVAATSRASPCRSGCSAAASRDTTRPDPGAEHGGRDHEDEGHDVDLTMAMKMRAWVMVGRVWPDVQGPRDPLVAHERRTSRIAVVGANEPMPRVSKKFVTKPMTSSRSEGRAASSPCGRAARARARGRPGRASRDRRRQPPRGRRRGLSSCGAC